MSKPDSAIAAADQFRLRRIAEQIEQADREHAAKVRGLPRQAQDNGIDAASVRGVLRLRRFAGEVTNFAKRD